ncbi:hypothetical protein, partial [uncultured Agrobacterium sp.]|uniref:hypothetical protein n=1 Tax=uncultured Agrobacterium sp. TaxID=157277 RepID=UPI0025F5C6B3
GRVADAHVERDKFCESVRHQSPTSNEQPIGRKGCSIDNAYSKSLIIFYSLNGVRVHPLYLKKAEIRYSLTPCHERDKRGNDPQEIVECE